MMVLSGLKTLLETGKPLAELAKPGSVRGGVGPPPRTPLGRSRPPSSSRPAGVRFTP